MLPYIQHMWYFFFFLFSSLQAQELPSFPYVVGEAYISIADWKFERGKPFPYAQVKRGDTIYVDYDSLRAFRKIARKIKVPFIVISANDDRPLPNPHHERLLNIKNVAAWFVGNRNGSTSDRVIALPIGVTNQFWQSHNIQNLKSTEKDILLYVNFTIATNAKKRQPCWDYFLTKSWAYLATKQTYTNYVEQLSRSVFTVSPPGNGEDCFRTWEALCLRSYPIVLRSDLQPLYEDLPVVVIDSWEEVTEEFLRQKKEEFDARKWNYEKAYLPFWLDQVRAVQDKIRKERPSVWELFFH